MKKYKTGDKVQVVGASMFSGRTAVVEGDGVDAWDYSVRFSTDDNGGYGFDEFELELVTAKTPDVGDTVRVSFEGTVERCEDRDGGVVMVGVPDGGAIWVKAKHTEVTSKAVKEPVVLRAGDLISSNDLKHLPVGSAFANARPGGIAYTVARKNGRVYGTSYAGNQYIMNFSDKKSYKIIYIANNTESVEVPNA